MPKTKNRPKRLYKYRSFNNFTLQMMVADVIHYSDPRSFNDPLDTSPRLETDVCADVLEQILSQLVEHRIRDEMSAAAKNLRYRGPRTMEHIERLCRNEAERLLADIRYNATDPTYEVVDPTQFLLGQSVEEEFLRRYNKGVFSLARRANCPLMWSHYGDQHNGLCLGYSVPDGVASDLFKIKYGGNRLVAASLIAAMLEGDDGARQKVDEAVLLRKAAAWRYEDEWRLLGPKGTQESPLELEEVIFGMRCDSTVMYTVVKALESRERSVKFYEICQCQNSFRLVKRLLDRDELTAHYPRRARFLTEAFEQMAKEETALDQKKH